MNGPRPAGEAGEPQHARRIRPGRLPSAPVWSTSPATARVTTFKAVGRPGVRREKLANIVGLYLNPPDKAVVLFVDGPVGEVRQVDSGWGGAGRLRSRSGFHVAVAMIGTPSLLNA